MDMRRIGLVTTLTVCMLWGASVHAETWYVDAVNGDDANGGTSWLDAKATIQAGIDLSSAGDTVLLEDGTYLISAQILLDKAITVRGVHGAERTVIDAQSLARCVYMNHVDAMLEGVTLYRGQVVGSQGGAIYLNAGTLRRCIVSTSYSQHHTPAQGGGVLVGSGGVVIDCVVENNHCRTTNEHSRGGGIYIQNGGKVLYSTIRGNQVTSQGYYAYGGGVYVASGGILANSRIEGNFAGGANRLGHYGGGVYVESAGLVENCLIVNNQTRNNHGYGCGVYANGGMVRNSTIVGNSGSGTHTGGGVYTINNATVANCIIYFNTASSSPNVYVHPTTGTNPQYCITTPLPSSGGNIASDPLLMDRANGDYRLQAGSPGIDSGLAPLASAVDIDGWDRVGIPDIGAYEYAAGANSDWVTYGYTLSAAPAIEILSVSNRPQSNLVEVRYNVTDADSTTVAVRGYATTFDGRESEISYLDEIYPIRTLAEGTGAFLGDNVSTNNNPQYFVWDAGADIGASIQNLKLYLMASDTNTLPFSLHFVTLTNQVPPLTISRYAAPRAGYNVQQALLWALCAGAAEKSGDDLLAVGGTYDGDVIAQRAYDSARYVDQGYLTTTGQLWMAAQLGVRLATAGETQTAREATTAGGITAWTSYLRPAMLVNEYGIDTTDTNDVYFVQD